MPSSTALKPQFSPISIARILWKHRWRVAVVIVVGSIIASVIVHRLPAVYRAEAVLLVDSQKIPERYVASTVSTDVQERLATISQQILSTTLLLKIINDFGLYKEERTQLTQEEVVALMRKDISITLETGVAKDRPGAFRVGYEGQNPTQVTDVANQLANLFINENLQSRERQAKGTADFIDSQLQDAKKTLDGLEVQISQYKLAHNGDLPEQQAALTGTLSRLQVELQGNQDAINRAEQSKVILQGNLDVAQANIAEAASGADASLPSGKLGTANPTAAPKADSEYLQKQYDAMSQKYEAKYPAMIALKRQIEKQRLAEEREQKRIENIKQQIALVDHEIAQHNAARERTLRSIAEYQGRTERLPIREQEMAALTRDYEMSKANYKSLLDKKLAAGMATDMEARQQGERFTLLDPAMVPEKPFKPNRPKFYAMGFALSLALALGIAIVSEAKRNVLLGEWELPTGLEVLGRVPPINPDSNRTSDAKSGDSKPAARKRKAALVSLVILALFRAGAGGDHLSWWGR
jgi:succinoglycan biosynthesis transport protein ExoP